MSIDGYTAYRKDRKEVKEARSDCVILYVKDEHSSSEVKELNDFKTETVWVRVIGRDTKLLIGVCFKNPNVQVEEVEEMFKVLEKAEQKHVIITGDFNYPGVN